MMFRNRICQTLHDEHLAALALVERLDQLLARQRRSGAPDMREGGIARFLCDLSSGVETELWRHFDFEESALFPFLNVGGEEALTALLMEEHREIRPVGSHVAALARAAADRGFDAAAWNEFSRLGGELCERMRAHVQKEEMGLLPVLEDSMDAETEARLLEEYLETT